MAMNSLTRLMQTLHLWCCRSIARTATATPHRYVSKVVSDKASKLCTYSWLLRGTMLMWHWTEAV